MPDSSNPFILSVTNAKKVTVYVALLDQNHTEIMASCTELISLINAASKINSMLNNVIARKQLMCDIISLLSEGANINAANENGDTLLHCWFDKRDVNFFLVNGANVNAKNKQGCTPLHCTIDEETIRVLIAHGADKNAQCNTGAIPSCFRTCVKCWQNLTSTTSCNCNVRFD